MTEHKAKYLNLLPEYRVIFLWDDNKIDRADNSTLNWMVETMRLRDPELVSRFVRDEENPDYIIATDKCFVDFKACKKLKHYFLNNPNSIFIFYTYELVEPNLTIFDYAFTWNREHKCGDRICRNLPYIFDFTSGDILTNNLTHDEAVKILSESPKFCNFVYSHRARERDSFFHMLSKYKRVEATGAWMNNTGIKSTRSARDWYSLSIGLKQGYKFSIAMENATYRDYTSEKLISSLQAHTVPIYWGNPDVAELINPKAFINCHDYSSFEEVIERVKEIDNNDNLWLEMVTQPWQTDEQYAKTRQIVGDYHSFFRHIFTQDIKKAARRPRGVHATTFVKRFTGLVGIMPPFYVRFIRGLRPIIASLIPNFLKPIIKEKFDMD